MMVRYQNMLQRPVSQIFEKKFQDTSMCLFQNPERIEKLAGEQTSYPQHHVLNLCDL
jgi:hypothetical protein